MRRAFLAAFTLIVLCSLSASTALVHASYPGYSTTNYQAMSAPVEDGRWTTSSEWVDAMVPPNLPVGFHWREKWTWPEGRILEHFLMESLTDSTNDTGDYFQLCFDCLANGGTAPQADDIKIEYVGHLLTGLSVYRGNGTGWAKYFAWTWGTDLFLSESLSSSPLNSNSHWIVELLADRSAGTIFDVSGAGYAPWSRLAVYDASNSSAGVRAWPPTSPDVPNDWGLETGTTENIPEHLTIAAVVLLSFVAMIVGYRYLRKRPKIMILRAEKL